MRRDRGRKGRERLDEERGGRKERERVRDRQGEKER